MTQPISVYVPIELLATPGEGGGGGASLKVSQPSYVSDRPINLESFDTLDMPLLCDADSSQPRPDISPLPLQQSVPQAGRGIDLVHGIHHIGCRSNVSDQGNDDGEAILVHLHRQQHH